MLRAAWTMIRDERTIGTVLGLLLVGIVVAIYYGDGEEAPESSRQRGETGRQRSN
jgi:hypothetical protein